MNISTWDDLEVLFEQALELPPSERPAFVEEVGREAPDLKAELESLLKHYQDAPAFFDSLVKALPTPPPGPEQHQPTPLSDPHALVGKTFSHYLVLDTIGGGGMGVVYLARDTNLERKVALKFLPPHLSFDEQAKLRFITEAKAASALDHANICTIHEIGETEQGQLFIAMAYYEGETLKQKVAHGPLTFEETLDCISQTARGLTKAHKAGIVHRDIKPANLMFTHDGVVKILDFGLAKMSDLELTRSGTRMGTVAYMSPEQARGDSVDHRTDIWAMGVVLYEMLTGERPFKGDYEQALIYSLLNEEPRVLSEFDVDIPAGVEHIVRMCLEKDVAVRYPSVEDVLADLEVFRSGSGSFESRVAPPERAKRTTFRKNWLVGTGVLVTLLLVLSILSIRSAWFANSELPSNMRLAVLPFANVSGDPDNQAFIDGLVYTMTSKLAGMERFQNTLSVVPASEVLSEGVRSPTEAAEALNVNLVLEGSIQQSGSAIILTGSLADARHKPARVLRPISMNLPQENLVALQDSIVIKLAALLDVELEPEARKALTAGRTNVSQAYDDYTRALGYLQKFEEETNIDRAINLFELAIQEDSMFALAYAGLGEAYVRKYWVNRGPDWIDKAILNGEKAVEKDDELAPVHATLGMIYYETGRYEKAELALLRALTFDENDAASHHQLGWIYYQQDKLAKAEASFQNAINLKPDYWLYTNDLGQFYSRLTRHRDAIPQFERVIELRPENPWGYTNVGVQYHNMGELDEAIKWYLEATTVNPSVTSPVARAHRNLGAIYFEQDEFEEATIMFERVLEQYPNDLKALKSRGSAYYMSGDSVLARESWLQMIPLAGGQLEINPLDATTIAYLAEVYAALGDEENAKTMIGQLLNMDRKDASTYVTLAIAYESLNDRPSALTYAEEALKAGISPSFLEAEAWLDQLRTDPDYIAFIEPYLD